MSLQEFRNNLLHPANFLLPLRGWLHGLFECFLPADQPSTWVS